MGFIYWMIDIRQCNSASIFPFFLRFENKKMIIPILRKRRFFFEIVFCSRFEKKKRITHYTTSYLSCVRVPAFDCSTWEAIFRFLFFSLESALNESNFWKKNKCQQSHIISFDMLSEWLCNSNIFNYSLFDEYSGWTSGVYRCRWQLVLAG